MADNLRSLEERIDTDIDPWNTGFHICGKSQRDRKGNFKRRKIFRSFLATKQATVFFRNFIIERERVERDELQCHRVKIDVGFD
jgi:hypothetical protein